MLTFATDTSESSFRFECFKWHLSASMLIKFITFWFIEVHILYGDRI